MTQVLLFHKPTGVVICILLFGIRPYCTLNSLFMAFKKQSSEPLYHSIVSDVKAGKFAPVYYLMGEEAYYIDSLCGIITDAVLPDEEDRDFNMMTFFGPDTTTDTVISAAKGLPMMGERLLVIVKEAQALRDIDKLEFYLRQPSPTSVLVFCHKNGKLDGRKKVASVIGKVGVLFESMPPSDRELLGFISAYSRQKNFELEPRAVQMMAEHIGADLLRMASELDKLAVALPQGQGMVTCDMVSDLIGISKQFNLFEFQDAIGNKDVKKANEIANYFDKNKNENPIQATLASLYKYFANLMQAYYSPDKSERGIAAHLGLQEWQVRRNILPAMRHYNGMKCMYILNAIRKTDARSKGVDNPNTESGELMKELLFYIFN